MENGLRRIMAEQARKVILHEMHGEMPLLAALLADYDELRRDNEELQRNNDELRRDNEELRRQVAAQHDGDWDGEEWRDIAGYEGLYQISNRGLVMSFHRGRCIVMKPTVQSRGYAVVWLFCGNGKQYNALVHRLVAQAFIPNPDDKREVNHKNGVKTDNRVENLEWVAPSENKQHAFDTGLYPSGESNYQAKLTNDQVRFIRANAKKIFQKQFAEMFGVSQQVISRVILGKTYKHVK